MATYYIGTDGDDTTGDGSENLPWLNLDYAVNESISGDTIILLEGTIVQTVNVSFNISGEDRTFIGQGRNGKCIIDCETNNLILNIICFSANTLIFKNIYFLGGRYNFGYNFRADNGATFDFDFCTFKHIVVHDESDVRQPRRSMFGCDDVSNATGSSFYLNRCYLIDNYVFQRAGKYFNSNYISDQNGNSCDYYVTNCTFYHSKKEQPVGKNYISGVIGGSVQPPTEFRNCVFYNDRETFIIQNNFGSMSDAGFINSYLFNMTEKGTYIVPTATNFFTDPMLVDIEQEILEPRPISPLIENGIN